MNNMPPKNIDPSDLWAQLIQLPRPHRIIESPLVLADGSKVPMGMWVLLDEETTVATMEADKWTKKMLKENGQTIKNDEKSTAYDELYNTRSALEILHKACRKAHKIEERFFSTVQEMSKKLTTDQIGCLLREYFVIQQELGPIIANMEQYEFDAWVEKIAEAGSAHFLGLLTLGAQNQFIVSMACQLHSLQTDKCSLITQQENNS